MGAAHDVDVHLADNVANAGNVEFFRLEVVADELRDLPDEEGDFGEVVGGELVEIFDSFFDCGDDEEPGESGVVFQEDLAATTGADEMSAFFQARMEFKCHRRTLREGPLCW